MKCEHCGRGITFRRVERDAAAVVVKADGSEDWWYCGPCFQAGRRPIEEGEHVFVVVYRGYGEPRYQRLVLDET